MTSAGPRLAIDDVIHVVIADDHEVVRSGIRSLLATIDDIDVVGEAASGGEAVAVATELVPDVVLLDLQMPGGHGLDATREITTTLPRVAVVILTMYEDGDSIDAALRGGARGYLLKGASQNDVVDAIRAAARGHVILSAGAAERLMERLSAPSGGPSVFPELTDRDARCCASSPTGTTTRPSAAHCTWRRRPSPTTCPTS